MKTVKKYSADWYAQAEKKIRQDIHEARMLGDKWYRWNHNRQLAMNALDAAATIVEGLTKFFRYKSQNQSK